MSQSLLFHTWLRGQKKNPWALVHHFVCANVRPRGQKLKGHEGQSRRESAAPKLSRFTWGHKQKAPSTRCFELLNKLCLKWEVCWKCSWVSFHTSRVSIPHTSQQSNWGQTVASIYIPLIQVQCVCWCRYKHQRCHPWEKTKHFTGDWNVPVTGTYLALVSHQLRYVLCILILTELGFQLSKAKPKMLRQPGGGQWLNRDWAHVMRIQMKSNKSFLNKQEPKK